MREARPRCKSPFGEPKEEQVLLEVGESLVCLGNFKVNRPGMLGKGVWGAGVEVHPESHQEPEVW